MDELRQALKTCDLCAFIDLDVELVLSFSAAQKPQQEQLDRVAKLASGLLKSSSPVLGGQHDQNDAALTEISTFLTGDRSYFLLRSSLNPSEVIFCQCGTTVDPKTIEAGARLTLQWILDAA